MAAKKKPLTGKIAAQNRKARHDYFIKESVEAGIVLMGSEVKSLREGRASIGEAFAQEKLGEIYLSNAHISEYKAASRFGHDPRRDRKLLLRRKEIARLIGASQRQGMTLVPLSIYFNDRGIAKLELALAEGKHTHDKRESIKTRDWQRQKARIMRDRG